MSTILVGVDPAAPAAEAIAFARALADAEGADLQHVSARRGESAAQLLHQRAEASDAHLVVLGSSHTGRFGRVVPGGTGERLLHGSPCAVAVVPRAHPGGAIARIGVAYDASPEADAALGHALDLARALDAAIELVGVVAPDPYEADESAHSVQVQLERALRELPFAVDGTIVRLHGEPADALARHSAHLDLLVTGSRGYGPLRSVIVGGVSGRLLRTARCPVVIVPRTVGAPTP